VARYKIRSVPDTWVTVYTDDIGNTFGPELEARWNKALAHAAEVEGKIATHDAARPMSAADPATLASLAADLKIVWTAPTTDARLKKRIVRTLMAAYSIPSRMARG
jgi:hypothetical protein